jgi:steroid 5-alpha reductase family enzyme
MFAEVLFHLCMFAFIFSWKDKAFLTSMAFIYTSLVILAFPGGIRTLEARAMNTWGAEYAQYKKETSIFVPWFRKRGIGEVPVSTPIV